MKKKHIWCGAIAFLLLLITFYTDTKIFTTDPLNMNCLPIDIEMSKVMHVLTKVGVFGVFFGLAEFFAYSWNHKKTLLFPFLIFLGIYGVGLLATYPGYFMSDDPIIWGYATRFYPVYWHHYLTSLYYMIGMSIMPASMGPVFLSDICYSLVYAYIFHQASEVYNTKIKYGVAILALLPPTLLGVLMCFRPALYTPFFVFYFAMLFFDYKKHAELTKGKLFLLLFLTVILCQWRSEGLVLIAFAPFLLAMAYRKCPFEKRDDKWSLSKKRVVKMIAAFLIFAVLFTIVKLPQSMGEKKYYGKDYLIISTTRPLSVIVHREQTYEGAEEDLANVSAITEFGYLHNDSLSCSAYNRYNTDYNEGRYTQTGADEQTQNEYIKSAFRLILKNFDLYLGERLQLFLVTNGIYNYNKDMVLNLKPVVSNDFHLYNHDRDYGFELLEAYKRIPVEGSDSYALFLYKFGGEAYIPCLILAMALLIGSFVKKKWFLAVAILSLFARETIIFLSAPASFIQYSYPMMFVTLFSTFVVLCEWREQKHMD